MALNVPGNNITPSSQGEIKSHDKTDDIISKNIRNEPLDLSLPDLGSYNFGKDYSFGQKKSSVESDLPFDIKQPSWKKDEQPFRIISSNANTIVTEFGDSDSPMLKMKIRRQLSPNFNGDSDKAKISVDSPFVKDYLKDYASENVLEPIKNKVWEPFRESVGGTVADTTLAVVGVASVVAISKHLPDKNAKVSLPTNKYFDEDFKAKLILGYGNGQDIKVTGLELKETYYRNNKNIEVKARVEKKEINNHKNVTENGLDINVVSQNQKWNDPVFTMGYRENKVTGKTFGLYYYQNF